MRHKFIPRYEDELSFAPEPRRSAVKELDWFLRSPSTVPSTQSYAAVQDDKVGLAHLKARFWDEPHPPSALEATLKAIEERQKALSFERKHGVPQANGQNTPNGNPQNQPQFQPQSQPMAQPPFVPVPAQNQPNSTVQTIQNELQREINHLAERIARTLPAHGGGNGGGGSGQGCSPEQIAHFNRQLALITSQLQSIKPNDTAQLEQKIDQLQARLGTSQAQHASTPQIQEDVQRLAARLEDMNHLNKMQSQDLAQTLELKIETMARSLSQSHPDVIVPLARKVEALETQQAQNMASLEQLLSKVVQKIEHQAQPQQDTQAFEGLVARLAQKMETSDKRFDQLENSLLNVLRIVERSPLPQATSLHTAPMQDAQLQAVQSTLEGLVQKLQPQAHLMHEQVQQKERETAYAAPQAYQEAIRVAAQPYHEPMQEQGIKNQHLRNFAPQSSKNDAPLEIGSGAPRLRLNKAPLLNDSKMPEMKSSFISSAKRLAQSQAKHDETVASPRVEKQNLVQDAPKSVVKRVVLTLAGLLVLLAGLKMGYDYLATPAPVSPQRSIITPKEAPKTSEDGWKKAPLSQSLSSVPQASAPAPLVAASPQQIAAATPPQGIDPMVTGASSAKLMQPGSAISSGWAPVVPTAQEKAAMIVPATLKKAAEMGNPSALYELGNRHADGVGAPKNFAESFRSYKAAADGGLALAQFRMAGIYEKGSYGERDIAKAIIYYGKAAKQGHINAMYNLGVLLASPLGGNDHKLATTWFKEAAEHGFVDAQYNLAAQYLKGQGIEKSVIEAYKWFAIAGQAGDKDAANQAERMRKSFSPEELARVDGVISGFTARKEAESASRFDMPAGGWGDSISAKPKSGLNS